MNVILKTVIKKIAANFKRHLPHVCKYTVHVFSIIGNFFDGSLIFNNN